ncbi:hypothetical protein PN471_07300 [Aphanizomenon sp. CS-733/32]|uniref:hypothetical protein n=1 Tax=Aphanizomenon sp. CS-733/32 TaxID=3021715 RepID=UPI00232ED783|nr:hypothetical protein [Aphanizomenon sp. CS-733/32]MDB9308445.1 hypothetical protein [Aphanizomenon sp. CS-733/32]
MIALGMWEVRSPSTNQKSDRSLGQVGRSRFGEMALMKERRSLSWLFLPHFPRTREFSRFCLLDYLSST